MVSECNVRTSVHDLVFLPQVGEPFDDLGNRSLVSALQHCHRAAEEQQVGQVSDLLTAMLTLPRICSGILPAFFSD